MSIVCNLHNSKPLTSVVDESFLADVNAFNKEALLIMALVEELRPESEAFSEMGEQLQKVLDAGLENLTPNDLQRFHARLHEVKEWKARFQPRYNALMDRVAAQGRRETELNLRARNLGAVIDFHQLGMN